MALCISVIQYTFQYAGLTLMSCIIHISMNMDEDRLYKLTQSLHGTFLYKILMDNEEKERQKEKNPVCPKGMFNSNKCIKNLIIISRSTQNIVNVHVRPKNRIVNSLIEIIFMREKGFRLA